MTTNRWKPPPDWLFKQFSCFGIPYTNHNIFSNAYDGPIQRTPNQTLGSWSFLHENRRSPSRLYFKKSTAFHQNRPHLSLRIPKRRRIESKKKKIQRGENSVTVIRIRVFEDLKNDMVFSCLIFSMCLNDVSISHRRL
jgi:hypothetical protein